MEWVIAILVLVIVCPLLEILKERRKKNLIKEYSRRGVEARRRNRNE